MRNVFQYRVSRSSLLWMSRMFAIVLLPLMSLVIVPTPPAFACGRSVAIAPESDVMKLENGLRLGLSEEAVEQLLGQPKERRRPNVRCPSRELTLAYAGGKVIFDRDPYRKRTGDSKVVTIIATSSDWGFPQGGRVGDTYEQIIQRYGKPDNPQKSQPSYLRYYIESDYVLDMAFSPQGKVIWLRLSSAKAVKAAQDTIAPFPKD